MPDRMIGERVAEIRRAKKLSQRRLALLTEKPTLSPAYISRIESGDRQPSYEAVRSLAAALDVEPHLLAWGKPRECWAILDLARTRIFGPFDTAREARGFAHEHVQGGLVLEMEGGVP